METSILSNKDFFSFEMDTSMFQQVVSMIHIGSDALADLHDECMRNGSTNTTLWTFPWEKRVVLDETEVYLREIVNSLEFREYLSTLLSNEPYYTVAIHSLERDGKIVYSDGEVELEHDNALLIATFTSCCEDCGKKVVNGRMTCFCWADQEDLALQPYR